MIGRFRNTAIVGVALLALLGAACGGDASAEEGGGSGPVAIEVMLSEFAISPSTITAPADTPIDFSIMNLGTAAHTFAVETPDGQVVSPEIAAGATGTLSVPGLAAGDYRVLCTVVGHADLGMVGSLSIGGDAAASGDGMSVSDHAQMTVEEMLAGHEQGVVDFPAETEGAGNTILEPTLEDGWKVFRITVSQIRWETKPGVFVDAMAYNGTVPGPELRMQPGDKVRIIVTNEMDEPTIMHFHGFTIPNAMDGVPFITQDPILPGGYFTYEFTVVDPPGMYVYHSHFNSTEQVSRGLYGSIIVEPKSGVWPYPSVTWDANGKLTFGASPRIGTEYTLFLGDGPLGYTLNGKEFPATTP
ncbi:MAG: multicopper oxidase domain-containing protein, partial [Actinomycetota bacterium]